MSDLTPKGFSNGQYVDRFLLRDKLYQEDAITMKGVVILNNFPAADVVERKVGHWIFHPELKNIYGGKLIECSECRTQYLVMNVMEEIYCRHCGSKNQNGGQDDV